jgi:hypothetical protein
MSLPSAEALWGERLARSLQRCWDTGFGERLEPYLDLVGMIGSVLGDATDPHYLNVERHWELWREMGELLGVGPPPPGWGGVLG